MDTPIHYMANLNGSIENKTICFTGKDKLLNKWRANVLRDSSGNMSRLIKVAIRYYIKNGSTCCIGKVYLSEQDLALNEQHAVCVYLSDAPDITSWLRHIKEAGIKSMIMVRSILTDSLQPVSNPQDEWIPSPTELLRLETAVGTSIITQPSSVQHFEQAPPPAPADAHIPIVSATKLKEEIPLTETSSPKENKPRKKKPRSFAFSGSHFKN